MFWPLWTSIPKEPPVLTDWRLGCLLPSACLSHISTERQEFILALVLAQQLTTVSNSQNQQLMSSGLDAASTQLANLTPV